MTGTGAEAKLAAALHEAPAFIVSELDVLLATVADVGPDGTPDRGTISPIDQPLVDGFDQALARIDAALAEVGTAA